MTGGMAGHTKHGGELGGRAGCWSWGEKPGEMRGAGSDGFAEPGVLPAPRGQMRWPERDQGDPAPSAAERCLQEQLGGVGTCSSPSLLLLVSMPAPPLYIQLE